MTKIDASPEELLAWADEAQAFIDGGSIVISDHRKANATVAALRAAARPAQERVTDEMVQQACEIYSGVYVDDDKDMGDAMRAALTFALTGDLDSNVSNSPG